MTQELSIIPILKPDEKTFMALMSKNLDVTKEQLEATVYNEMYSLDYITQLYMPEISECMPITIGSAFRFVINNNLSFDKSLGLVHVTTRKHKIKFKDSVNEVRILEVKPTVNGLVSMCKQAGTLINVLPSGYNFDEKGYLKSITLNIQLPIYNSDGNLERTDTVSKTYDLAFFKKLKIASHRQNSFGKPEGKVNNKTLNNANALYSSYYPEESGYVNKVENNGGVDPEFANTKALRHYLEKLDKNPNAKIKKGIFHSKVVDESKEEILDGSYEIINEEYCSVCGVEAILEDGKCPSCNQETAVNVPNIVQPAVNVPQPQTQPPQPNVVPLQANITPQPAQIVTENSSSKENQILLKCESLTKSSEVKALFIENKDFVESVSGMKEKLMARYRLLEEQEKKPEPIKPSVAAAKPISVTVKKAISADDL